MFASYQPAAPHELVGWQQPHDSFQASRPPSDATGHIVFTRQLWKRNMFDESQTEPVVSNKSRTDVSQPSQAAAVPTPSRRSSSTVSLRPRNHSPSPLPGSTAPLTPEESPPFKSTRKRSAGFVEQEDKALSSAEVSPSHSRVNSGEQPTHVCICQPEPKVPRPRNAFILYRQHYQANVVAQNPGLANPEISKIIGERWQGLPPDEKGKWKALAEEEKLRHQQQYPTYRYQPKRNGRRNSLSGDQSFAGAKPKCQKCGGRTILTPSTPFSIGTSVPPTPGSSTITPVTRTLPVLRDLSLQSPGVQRLKQQHPNMSPYHNAHPDERDDVGSLSPGNKRRRYNGDHPVAVTRAMPPRYGVVPHGVPVGPGTPFPFGQVPQPPHAYPPPSGHVRRESLPGLRGVVSPPGPMGPPPRPGMGYQQHRMSQGHAAHDRSLILPPIQTAGTGDEPPTTGSMIRSAESQIMEFGFRNKLKVLSQVAPPARTESRRGPFIAVEGDSAKSAAALAEWLRKELSRDDDLRLSMLESPDISIHGNKKQMMAQCHRLAAEWLGKSDDIVDSLTMHQEAVVDAAMTDPNHDDARGASSRKASESGIQHDATAKSDTSSNDANQSQKMDIDKRSSTISSTSTVGFQGPKPVSIIANYSLHASNRFACAIPIGGTDPYHPDDHWKWAATHWRGIIGPDLTIYVRDGTVGESGKPSMEIEASDEKTGVALFVVRRNQNEEQMGEGEAKDMAMQLEPSALRRVGFEVSEWVKAFGSRK
ncbi:slightly ste11-like protein [Saxophila tyrrhenica]|uniref:Slightly ste11-like protein n=1 Tax=Saxophila tyrrhenica TaxID=1690608 RepID=A0AAV9PM50_9PEZI|nr:slightly ste11-like protein [Saxophila tyrrhenica]